MFCVFLLWQFTCVNSVFKDKLKSYYMLLPWLMCTNSRMVDDIDLHEC